MIRRGAGPGLSILVGAAAWWGWSEMDLLFGTPLWEFRYILLGGATILSLSLVEWIVKRLQAKGHDEGK